jgi:2'-5' RNA ligase
MATDHFERHGVQPGHVDWNFNVVFNDQPDVAQMAEEYAEIIRHPGLYPPIPSQWLHSTILAVGSTDDYTEEEMLAVAAKLQSSLAQLTLPEFVFDSWWLWSGGVVLHISPADEFTKLYDHVIEALKAVVGPERTTYSPHGKFVAHTGLAYPRTHHAEPEINRQLSSRLVKPAKFKATHMPLIRQWASGGHYEWEIVKDIIVGANE